MKTRIVVALFATFTIWVSGQTPVQTVPVVIPSDYYAQPKVLVLHALNNSGKDITGYAIIIRHKNPDGTVDKGGWSSSMSEMLSALITAEMAKDSGNKAFAPAGTGIFVAGETRDITLQGIDSGADVDATAGAVFYTDGTFDKQDEDAFKQMLAYRQHQLQQMRDEDELIRNALADATNVHPVAGVLTEINKRRVEEMDKGQQFPMDLCSRRADNQLFQRQIAQVAPLFRLLRAHRVRPVRLVHPSPRTTQFPQMDAPAFCSEAARARPRAL
jgi:hypothetical protein